MKVVFKNLFSLGFVQVIGLLVPLILTPYLIKTIGVSLFGISAAAQSAAMFFCLFTDFGFNVTSVRRIARSKGDPVEIEKIINSIFFLKLLLLLATFILFILLILIVPQFRNNFIIYLSSFFIVVGQTFLPIWYFQGFEKIAKTIAPSVIFKLLNVILIFFFVKSDHDTAFVNFSYGLSNLLTGIVLFYFIQKEYRISIRSVSIDELRKEFKDSVAIFVSNMGSFIYANSTVLILSFFVVPSVLGIYSIAEKIIQLLRSVLILTHQVVYPRLCNLIKEGGNAAIVFLKNFYGILWAGILLVCIFLFIEPSVIVSYFVKDEQTNAAVSCLLRNLSFLILLSGINMPFYQSLLAYHKDWLIVRILMGAAIFSLALNLVLIPTMQISGIVITLYATEALVTSLFMYFYFQFKKGTDENRKLFK
jgi:PST family polysaccharide transporter